MTPNNLNYDYSEVQESDFADIVNDLFAYAEDPDVKLVGEREIMIYSDQPSTLMTVDDIKAFSIFYVVSPTNHFYTHQLYVWEDGGFKLNSDLSVETVDFSPREISTLALGLVQYNTHVIHLSLFDQGSSAFIEDYQRTGTLGRAISETVDYVLYDINDSWTCANYQNCGTDPYECKKDLSGPRCPGTDNTICTRNHLEYYVSLGSSDFPDLPLEFAYNFRDNYMTQFPTLQKYIEYYARLSDFARSYKPFTSENLTDHLIFAEETYAAAGRLQNGNPETIVYSDDYVNAANELISYYKSLTTNLEYELIFDDIETDLAKYKGKTKQQIENIMRQ